VLRQERDFTVRAPSFPRITAIGQLVDALAYIAREEEYEHLQAAETPAEQKRRFDAFWGEHIPNRQEARNVIRTYYARVEEANLFFSTYKDGWKTDRGMLYVVLGAPLYVDRRIDSEVWVYNYGQRDESSVFVFERVPIYGSQGTFYNYVLQRDMMHDYRWRRILERWRNGEVL
jgi:GWxTD domain-containing protein